MLKYTNARIPLVLGCQMAHPAAELAVEFVRLFDEKELADSKFDILKSPENRPLVIHAALIRQADLETLSKLTSFLEVEPEWVATLLPTAYLQKFGSQVPAYRKQYQRIMAEQTRTMTFGLLEECPAGYALLYEVFRKNNRMGFEELWSRALKVIGQFNLEPFRAMALWISLLSENALTPFAGWISKSLWSRQPDWIAIVKLTVMSNKPKFLANLIVFNVVSLDTVWGMYTHKTETKFSQFEDNWRSENSSGPSRLNALAMAMPLIDDDDDDDDEEEDEEMLDEDIDLNKELETSTAEQTKSESDAADEDPNNYDAVENLRKIVGYALLILGRVPNIELENTLLKLAETYPIAFGTSNEFLQGLSQLLASKISQPNEEGRFELVENIDLHALYRYWKPISHSIMEPAWSVLNRYIKTIESPQLRFDTFREFLLPSIDVHPNKVDALFDFDINQRYMLYTDLYTRLAVSHELVKARFTSAERNTKDILKRLTKRDAETLIVPQLLEQFSQCAWPSLNVFVNQVESYNIGKLVAQAATQTRPSPKTRGTAFGLLAMDMLPLVLMQQFTVGRDATQKDGLHLSKWLRLLAQFAGDIASGHPQFDFVVLIKLVLHQFAAKNFSLIFVIDQILRQLSGVPLQSNLSPFQLLGLCSAPVVADTVQKQISEQPYPQQDRLLQKLRNDPDGDLVTMVVAALSYAYDEQLSEPDAKVMASKQDATTNLFLLLRSFELDASVDRSKICAKFAANLQIGQQVERPIDFNSLNLYDVAVEPKVYAAVQGRLEEKVVERALLSHKIRVKSVKQRLQDVTMPCLDSLLSRALLSPVDGLFTSKYIQLQNMKAGSELLGRGALLAVLNGATPLEIESYATFVVDYLSFLYLLPDERDDVDVQNILSTMAAVFLEAAVPEASFTVLNNVFNLLQRTLPVFPLHEKDGKKLSSRIQLLTTTTSGDLETAVKSLYPQLIQREKVWCGDEISPEFVANLAIYHERLMVRFTAGLKA